MKIKEGYMPFMGYRTYYRIAGECAPGKFPLLTMHGGPGSTHNYFELLDSIAESGHAVISYDQLGCGESYLDGHPELWTLETWMNELIELRKHLGLEKLHLLGQSWGGMLEIAYLIDQKPKGICSAVLSSTLPSSLLWGEEQHRLIKYMPEVHQKAIAEAERTGNYNSAEYEAANDYFMALHCAAPVTEDMPECLRRPKKSGSEAYLYGWGPNEYTPLGSLRDFNYTDRLCEIEAPCLIMSGTEDLCTPIIAKTMYDRIKDTEWELFAGCRHMPFAEDTEHYCRILADWLNRHDG